MPMFDTDRCRAWLQSCADPKRETLEGVAASLSGVLGKVTFSEHCLTLEMLIGRATAHPDDETHRIASCGYCRRMLAHFYFLYTSFDEVEPYILAVGIRHDLTVNHIHQMFACARLGSGEDCFGTWEVVAYDALPRPRRDHRLDCVSCDLYLEVLDGMTDIDLRR